MIRRFSLQGIEIYSVLTPVKYQVVRHSDISKFTLYKVLLGQKLIPNKIKGDLIRKKRDGNENENGTRFWWLLKLRLINGLQILRVDEK